MHSAYSDLPLYQCLSCIKSLRQINRIKNLQFLIKRGLDYSCEHIWEALMWERVYRSLQWKKGQIERDAALFHQTGKELRSWIGKFLSLKSCIQCYETLPIQIRSIITNSGDTNYWDKGRQLYKWCHVYDNYYNDCVTFSFIVDGWLRSSRSTSWLTAVLNCSALDWSSAGRGSSNESIDTT